MIPTAQFGLNFCSQTSILIRTGGVADIIFIKADTIHGVANTMLSVADMMYFVANLMGLGQLE